MSDALPSSWKKESLVEISDFRRGSFPQPYGNPEWYDDSGFPFVQVYDLGSSNLLKPTTKVRISTLAAEKSVFVPKGTVLVSIQGSIGRVVVTQYDAYVDRTILIFTQISSNLDRDFFALMVREIFELKKNEADGGVIKTITKETLKDFLMVVPPLSEQQKIAKILISVDEFIEKTRAQIDKLKDLKTGMMQELLTNGIGHTEFKDSAVGRIPAEWEVVTLGDVTIESAFGPRFSSDEYADDGNFGCIITTDMDENWDINYSTAPLARLNFKEFEKHILVDGDLLVTRSGTCGLVDVFREQPMPMIAAAFLIRFRLTENMVPFFVKYLMMSADIQENVQLLASGGVQKNLSGTSLKTLKIPKPSIQEQIKIVNAIESINNRLANAKKKLSLKKKLKKALMQDLLTGKVRVKADS